jgi:hypothetical protein
MATRRNHVSELLGSSGKPGMRHKPTYCTTIRCQIKVKCFTEPAFGMIRSAFCILVHVGMIPSEFCITASLYVLYMSKSTDPNLIATHTRQNTRPHRNTHRSTAHT